MASEKIFYKYQSLKVAVNDKGKVLKDNNGNNIIYSIKNLANNQLYFNDPTKFNDPFDCKFNVVQIATREQWIIFYMSGGVNELLATMYFTFNVTNKILIETEDNLYLYDYIKDIKFKIKQGYLKKEEFVVYNKSNRETRNQIGVDMNDYLRSEGLPLVCCFSGTGKNILLWSHYADYHQGICLKFKSYKRMFKVNENYTIDYLGYIKPDKEYDFLDLYKPSTKKVTPNIFYKIDYKPNPPEPINFFDELKNLKFSKFIITKYADWTYEDEYRLVVGKGIPENGVVNYRKEELEGVIFGLKIGYNDAKLVYETIKENYLDKGFNVNFYEAKEVVGKYEVELELINDVEIYLDDLL
jgi:hypothetical protein